MARFYFLRKRHGSALTSFIIFFVFAATRTSAQQEGVIRTKERLAAAPATTQLKVTPTVDGYWCITISGSNALQQITHARIDEMSANPLIKSVAVEWGDNTLRFTVEKKNARSAIKQYFSFTETELATAGL